MAMQTRHRAAIPLLALLAGLFVLAACGNAEQEAEEAAAAQNEPVEQLYNNGVDALHDKRYTTAIAQFDALQQNYPYSTWAANAQLMEGYTLYLENKYTEAIGSLDRFIQLHPSHRDIAYAYYLRALSYYEQIDDIQRDQAGTDQATTSPARRWRSGAGMSGRTSTPRRSGASSASWTTTRPPTTCPKR
jgi:outer membrane protein assembly factor BamD